MASSGMRVRHDTRKPLNHHECRVVHGLDKHQPELARSLRELKDASEDFVDYKWDERGQELNRLGVTLVMLEPVLRQILPVSKQGPIGPKELGEFESGLRDHMEDVRFVNQEIPLDEENPLGLYGKNNDQLALRLDRRDGRLPAERAAIEHFIKENYDQNNGGEVTNKFLSRKLTRFDPHITIGTVDYDVLSHEERSELQADPTNFMRKQIHDTDFSTSELYKNSGEFENTNAILPSKIALNGLRIFSQPR